MPWQVAGKPDPHVLTSLRAAWPDWSPGPTCVYGFEPNRAFTKVLHEVKARVKKLVTHLEIATETAAVGHRRPAVHFTVDHASQHSIGSTVSTAASMRSVRVDAINLVDWLRRSAPSWAAASPIVIRLDIEGTEYALLRDLVVSGLSRSIPNPLHVALEWHRFLKHRSMASEMGLLSKLDEVFGHFNRAPSANAVQKKQASSLVETYEKQLAYWLAAANITLSEHVQYNTTRLAHVLSGDSRRRRLSELARARR